MTTPTKADILNAAAIERMIAKDALVPDDLRRNALHRAVSLDAIAKDMDDE
jgi:hypothetical protein